MFQYSKPSILREPVSPNPSPHEQESICLPKASRSHANPVLTSCGSNQLWLKPLALLITEMSKQQCNGTGLW